MEKQDKDVLAKFILVIGLLVIFTVVAFLVARLLSTVTSNSTQDAESDEFAQMQIAKIEERIAPVGQVVAGEVATGPVIRSGKEIVETTCNSCHGTGVLGAPKIGDAADWGTRFGQGMKTIMDSAINGKGNMPARGGDGSLSDEDLKKAIVYMLKESGQSVADADSGDAQAEEVVEKTEATSNAAPVVEEKAAVITAVAAATASTGKGEETYKAACALCHDAGVASAPKLGDKAAWADRVAAGADTLYRSAIGGKGAMPPKGGRADLSNEAIKAAVDFMVGTTQ